MQPSYYHMMTPFLFASLLPLLPIFFVWSIAWKGWALWLAARRKETLWFIALLILNTAGLLEIFYIFVIAKRNDTVETPSKPSALSTAATAAESQHTPEPHTEEHTS